MRKLIFLVLLATALLACGSRPVVVAKSLPSPVITHRQEVLDPKLVAEIVGERDGDAYRVGPGDTLLVAVYGHPELAIAPYAGAGSLTANSGRLSGLAIDNDGTIQFPLIGTVQVAGKTSAELRQFLEQELVTYVKDPKVTVQVVFTGSIRYYLLGQFTQPGLKYSDRPLRLLEALSLGGSVQLESASLRSAYVARKGKRLPINFYRLIREGDLTQDIRLRSGDVVLVPDNTNERAYVFGGASGSNPKGGTVNFVNGRLTLLQALAQVGFGTTEQVQGKLSETYVIRSEADRGELFRIDAERLLRGEAANFELAPGDVVYVPPTWVTSWNQVLNQLLPTLQTISGVLAPFVQIKYLSQ
ncbi:MAG TPA: polysaccharide biosynthesis/export family protein [Polyangiaceae bacterium]|nr:polysaccharide biosynthesis/export family protein [Polyangiaceae bacterium]